MYYQKHNNLQNEITIRDENNKIVCRINMRDYDFDDDAYDFAEFLVSKLNNQ